MGSTRERYVIELAGDAPAWAVNSGGTAAFDGCKVVVAGEDLSESKSGTLLTADVERGGVALSALLRRLLADGLHQAGFSH